MIVISGFHGDSAVFLSELRESNSHMPFDVCGALNRAVPKVADESISD